MHVIGEKHIAFDFIDKFHYPAYFIYLYKIESYILYFLLNLMP